MALKLRELQLDSREEDIFVIAKHYEMLVREVKNITGYSSLSYSNPQGHRNWRHFEYIYEACRMKEWDAKLYIESQFDRVKGWVNGITYPLPAHMYSVNAFRHFTTYLSTIKQKYEEDTGGIDKKKGRETRTNREAIIEGILSATEILNMYMTNSNIKDKSQYKALRIYQSWQEFSPYYLWSIPWFHAIVPTLGQSIKARECSDQFDMISNSVHTQETIKEIVPHAEKLLNIPTNIEI